MNTSNDEIISFAINENLTIVKKDCKIGFIDKYGKQIIACHYQDAEDFYQGLALVEKNEKKGYIDKRGLRSISKRN